MKGANEEQEAEGSGEALRVWDCGSPLYDSFELVSLSHVIERHLMALPSTGTSNWPNRLSSVSSACHVGDGKKLGARVALPSSLRELVGKTRRMARSRQRRKEGPKELKISNFGFHIRMVLTKMKIAGYKRKEAGLLV